MGWLGRIILAAISAASWIRQLTGRCFLSLKRSTDKLIDTIKQAGGPPITLAAVGGVISIAVSILPVPFWWCVVLVSALILLIIRRLWSWFPVAARLPAASRSIWSAVIVAAASFIVGPLLAFKYRGEYPPQSVVYLAPGVLLLPSTWTMMIRHCGPAPLYNVSIDFIDSDRMSAMTKDHTWSAQGMSEGYHAFGPYQEIDPTVDIYFYWNALESDRHSYAVRIKSREAIFDEVMDLRRTSGIGWAYKMNVTDVTLPKRPVKIIECQDAGFAPSAPADHRLPACFPHYTTGQHRGNCD